MFTSYSRIPRRGSPIFCSRLTQTSTVEVKCSSLVRISNCGIMTYNISLDIFYLRILHSEIDTCTSKIRNETSNKNACSWCSLPLAFPLLIFLCV